MGATVSSAKLAAAFSDSQGKPFYVLFEETFEKNVYPHTPRWGCYAIGRIENVMERIFSAGAACVGGSLQGAGGREITPEGYIAGWLKELASPMSFPDMALELSVGDDWNSPIATGDFEWAKTVLVNNGFAAIATALEDGQTVPVSLHADCDLLGAIYAGRPMGPWRVIKSHAGALYGTRTPELGFQPTKAKVYKLPAPRFLSIPNDGAMLLQGTDGNWSCEGASWLPIAEYVRSLWAQELNEPGSYRARIKAFRAAIASAAPVQPERVKIIFDTTVQIKKYQQSNLDAILKDTPHASLGSEIHLTMPTDPTQLYRATNLPAEAVKWVITENEPFEQMSLLAG